MNTRSLRYLFARIEKFICEHTNQSMQNDVEYISTKNGGIKRATILNIFYRIMKPIKNILIMKKNLKINGIS